jgi:hypothetical protein
MIAPPLVPISMGAQRALALTRSLPRTPLPRTAQLQRIAKPPAAATATPPRARAGLPIPGAAAAASASTAAASTALEGDSDGDVSAAMLTRLRDLPEALGRAREVGTFLGDALSAADVEEGLDVLEALADVAGPGARGRLAPPPDGAADWLRRAAAGEGLRPLPGQE